MLRMRATNSNARFRANPFKPAVTRALSADEHATLYRLLFSRHVKDLRLIVGGALAVLVILLKLGPIAQLPAASLLKFITPLIGAFGVLLAWAYQTGSARLGVVDLFACEISTLCRITTVMGAARRLVYQFNAGPATKVNGNAAASIPQFNSQENYFPVFDSCIRDLQTLDAEVVINITAFYTYMKALRDSMRALTGTSPQAEDFCSPSSRNEAPGAWHDAARNIVYLLYLSLESARKSIRDLVEFEPELIERTIVILISELEVYGFLRQHFAQKDDFRHERIKMRQAEYQQLVPELDDMVETGLLLEQPDGTSAQLFDAPVIPRWLSTLR